MDGKVNSEMVNIFNLKNVHGTERTKILAISNTLVNDGVLVGELKNSITSVIERDGFNIEKNIGSVISCIIKIFQQVEFYKDVSSDRMEFVIYCLLLSLLQKFYPTILTKVEISTLRGLYVETYDLVTIIPETIKIAKQGCLTCLGKYKLLSALNKGKIIVK